MHNAHLKTSALLAALLTLGGAALSGGCAVDGTVPDESATPPSEGEDVASDQEAEVNEHGWEFTSEEYAPALCDTGSLPIAAWCIGDYCDNVGLMCWPTGASTGDSYWTPYFSEENSPWAPSAQFCGQGYWITGLRCAGSYCDDVSFRCSHIPNVAQRYCYWTGAFSEEEPAQFFTPGSYAVGAQCTGSYCDNMNFYVCHLG